MEQYKNLLYPLLLLLTYSPGYSQGSFDSAFGRALSVYTTMAGTSSHLYNGSEYLDYDHKIKGNPFFASSISPTALYFTMGYCMMMC
jgi:hypothetical protein